MCSGKALEALDHNYKVRHAQFTSHRMVLATLRGTPFSPLQPVTRNLFIVITSNVVKGRQDRYTRSLKEREKSFRDHSPTHRLTRPCDYLTLSRPTLTSSPAISATPSTSLPHSTPSASPALRMSSVFRHSCTRWKHSPRQGVYR